MTRSFSLACFVFGAWLPWIALAQAIDDPAALIGRADANHDGVVSRREFLAARAGQFERIDRNHDGYLDSADAEGRSGRAARLIPLMVRMADTDHDGRVTAAEFQAMPARGFDRMDRNGDGVLDAAELAQAARQRGARRGG